MPTFLVRVIGPNEPRHLAGGWQKIEAPTEKAAVEQVCGFAVDEGATPANLCAEARADTIAIRGRMYRRAAAVKLRPQGSRA